MVSIHEQLRGGSKDTFALELRFGVHALRHMGLAVGSIATDAVRLGDPGQKHLLCVNEAEEGDTIADSLIDLLKGAGALGIGVVARLPDGTPVMIQVLDDPDEKADPTQNPETPPSDPDPSGDREPRLPSAPQLSPGIELVAV